MEELLNKYLNEIVDKTKIADVYFAPKSTGYLYRRPCLFIKYIKYKNYHQFRKINLLCLRYRKYFK